MTRRTLISWVMLLVAALVLPAAVLAQEQPGAKSKKTGKRRPREIVVVGSKAAATEAGQKDGHRPEIVQWVEQARRRFPRVATATKVRAGGGRATTIDETLSEGARQEGARQQLGRLDAILSEGARLNEEILRVGDRMTAAQAQSYERRMRDLVARMDRTARCKGNPGKEGPARCMCNCDKAYPGWGGGKGWNRFWCKAACIKLKVGKGGASVGG